MYIISQYTGHCIQYIYVYICMFVVHVYIHITSSHLGTDSNGSVYFECVYIIVYPSADVLAIGSHDGCTVGLWETAAL